MMNLYNIVYNNKILRNVLGLSLGCSFVYIHLTPSYTSEILHSLSELAAPIGFYLISNSILDSIPFDKCISYFGSKKKVDIKRNKNKIHKITNKLVPSESQLMITRTLNVLYSTSILLSMCKSFEQQCLYISQNVNSDFSYVTPEQSYIEHHNKVYNYILLAKSQGHNLPYDPSNHVLLVQMVDVFYMLCSGFNALGIINRIKNTYTAAFASTTTLLINSEHDNSLFFQFVESAAKITITEMYLKELDALEESLSYKQQLALTLLFYSINQSARITFLMSFTTLTKDVAWELFYNKKEIIEIQDVNQKVMQIKSNNGNQNKFQQPAEPIIFSKNGKGITEQNTVSHTTASYKKLYLEKAKDRTEKIKTKGSVNREWQIKTDHKSEIQQLNNLGNRSVLDKDCDTKRRNKLSLISTFRKSNSIQASKINSELTQLINFLPNAKEVSITGSEFRLEWEFDDKTYRIKYEKSHTSEYQGFKLKKILNVIECSYLWGWDQENIDKHLASKGRLLGRLADILLRDRTNQSTSLRL